ncbi:eukaryotic translation initiation factor 4G-like [Iris pallida]|uniref:Eukaryotic translation initiation factor 4G n=1 Tax=Iris pallida TaxID=29817 RepID=A0AAX6EKQ4_IRIPA|nr:eukaryotic translation initiation factor 4G-like [Iris pallida]
MVLKADVAFPGAPSGTCSEAVTPTDDYGTRNAGNLINASSDVAAQHSDSAVQTSYLSQNQHLEPSQDTVSKKVMHKTAPDIHDTSSNHEQLGNRTRQTIPQDRSMGEKQSSTMSTGNPSEVSMNPLTSDAPANNEENSVRHRKKNNKSARNNKNKLDEGLPNSCFPSPDTVLVPQKLHPGSRKSNPSVSAAEAKSLPFESLNATVAPAGALSVENSSEIPVMPLKQGLKESTEESHARVNNHWKPRPQRKSAKTQQTNKSVSKYNVGAEAVIWAPVKPLNKDGPSVEASKNSVIEATYPSGKSGHDMQSGIKAMRAEMGRYIWKPVAKELSQQVNSKQNSPSQSHSEAGGMSAKHDSNRLTVEFGKPDGVTVGKATIATDARNGENIKHNKHGKMSSSWRQRSSETPRVVGSLSSDPAKAVQKASDQLQPSTTDSVLIRDMTHILDGWNDVTNTSPPGGSVASTAVPKNVGANRQRCQPYKEQRVPRSPYPTDNTDTHRVVTDRRETHSPALGLLNESDGGKVMKTESENTALVTTHVFERDSYPSPGRIIDRSLGASRMDRRMAGVSEDERWTKASSFGPGRDIRLDMGYGAANATAPTAAGFTKSSKLIEDGSNVSAQELPRGSDTFHSLSGSDSPTAAAKLPCTNEEHARSVESLESESFEVKEIPALAVPEVTLVKEAPQGERFVSGISDSTSVNEQISVDSVLKDENLIVTEDETVEAPTDFSHDRTISGSSPVSTMIGTSEAVNSVKSVKQEDVRGKNSEKVNICEVFDEKEQIETNNEEVDCMLNADGKSEESDVSSVASSDIKDAVTIKYDTNSSLDIALSDPVTSPVESTPVLATVLSETKQKLEDQVAQLSSGLAGTVILSGPKDKITSEPARARTTTAKKKKRKELFSKADAAGTSDLYNAYKGPEEKNEVADSLENVDSSSTVNTTDVQADVHGKNAVAGEEDEQCKTEIDDWEDAADISTPKLKSEGDLVLGNEATNMKRYSRDFLLTFIDQCTDLPVGFEMGSDIADALMSSPVVTTHFFERDSYPSPGRIIDRSLGASRMDRRMAGVSEDERWTKASSFGPGRDIRLDMGYGAANVSSRAGQGINHGVLRNPRGQSNHFAGGILSGPVQSMPSQGGMPRSNSDADRWQRATGIQRGLIPSPHATSQIMHKATNKYEVGKVSDEEEAKQRQLKAILDKLTPQNFEKLFLQVKEVNIDNTITLTGVISQIFDKALTEPTFCEMYANFCAHLSNELPDFCEDNERITFKRLLLNKCQEEFERGEREEAEANRAEEDGEIKQTEAEREEKRTHARRRMLGNIRLIGELYKKRMLTERIMHECIKKLLGEYENPDEEDLEALCVLMSTIGEMIDYPKAKVHMDGYFVRMLKLSTDQKLSSGVRFMLRDAIDLRKNKWQQRGKIEGPKKIDEVHRDAAQERQARASRFSRGPVINNAPRRGPPADYSSCSNSVLPSLSSQQINSNRGMPAQVRGHATQDVRMDERQQFESRVLCFALPQRSTDDTITLDPQVGLARGMSIRGQPLMSNAPSADIPPNLGDSRRLASGSNSYNFMSREDFMPRYTQDKFSSAQYDQPSPYGRSSSIGSRDPQFPDNVTDKSAVTTIPGRIHASSGFLPAPSETKQLSQESLREKSISAIREFYSAKDEEEVILCIKELKSPSFYPSMVSLWVTDSFERKDKERDLLAKLLVNLCKSRDNLLRQNQLVQGFVSVLSALEDAVIDAPRAAEFLGHIFAKVTLEHVVPLTEIARLIREGGEEPGSLVETGLASEVLASILQFIRTEKGDSVLSEIRTSSGLRLEDFRPPHSTRSNKLDPFL